jgi:predicted GNAT family acetyltransferase
MAQTPPWPVMLAGPCEPDDTAVETVLAGWRSAGVVAPGVNGPEPWIRALVSASDRTVHDEMGLRLHLLDGKPRCAHPASGRARCAEEADIPMLQTWEDAFVAEVEADGNPPPTTADEVRQRLEHYLLWDDDGLRSMVRRTRPQLGGWSISGVYTPPEYRGHGYAGSVVHAMCERLVREGASYQALYTDLANPTSNHIYREIGFVPAGDQVRVLWTL